MRRWKIIGGAVAIAVMAGTVGLTGGAGAAPPTCEPSITIHDAEASEDAETGKISFPVTLTAPTGCDRKASVSYETQAFTGNAPAPADAGVDYEKPTATKLDFDQPGSGSLTKEIEVRLLDDDLPEKTEVFELRLFGATNNAKIIGPPAIGAIDDDEPAPGNGNPIPPNLYTMIIGSTPDCMDCPRQGTCPLIVQTSDPIGQPMTVTYTPIDGTAKLGEDFAVSGSQLTIPAGATQATVKVQVFANKPGEEREFFRMVLTSVSAGTIRNSLVEMHIPGF
jgi:Calx-beta domain